MKLTFKMFTFLTTFSIMSYASQINILYDAQSDGSIDPSSKWIVQMIKEAGEKNNIKVNFQGAPWERALLLIKDGIADGLINASYKESRAKFAVYPMKNGKLDLSKSLKTPSYFLYKNKKSPLDFDGEKLINANGKICAIKSYAVVDNLKNLNANIKFSSNVTSNLNSVLYEECIATAQLESEASKIINNNTQMKENIIKIDNAIRKKEYFLIVSKQYFKNNKDNISKIWNEIEQLKQTPKYINLRK